MGVLKKKKEKEKKSKRLEEIGLRFLLIWRGEKRGFRFKCGGQIGIGSIC